MRAVFCDSPVLLFQVLTLSTVRYKQVYMYTRIDAHDDKYCADVIHPFLMLDKNLNITNNQSDIEQMLRITATAQLASLHRLEHYMHILISL